MFFSVVQIVKTELKSPAAIVDANGLPLGPSHLDSTLFCTTPVANLDATQSSNAYDHKQDYYNYYNRYVVQLVAFYVRCVIKDYFQSRTACNNIRRRFTRPLTAAHTQQKSPRPRRFRHQTPTYHQAMPQITIQHNFTQLMETTTSDNLERRNKITRDTTMINTTVTTMQTIHPTSVRPARVAAKTFISQLCPRVRRKRSLERRRVLDIRRNLHFQSHQIPAIMHQTQKQRRQPKEKHVDEGSRTRVPRDRR